MLDMTFGEFFVVGFIFVAVVSAPYWPKIGARLFLALSGKNTESKGD